MDLDENLKLHRKGWIAKSIGRAAILGIMLAAALGLFSNGIMSRQVARQGTVVVESDRFLRNNSETRLSISMTGVKGRSVISFPLTYTQHLKVERISPEPERTAIRDGQVWYVFEADQNLLVQFYMKPQTNGNLHGSVWVNDQYLLLSHFIYP